MLVFFLLEKVCSTNTFCSVSTWMCETWMIITMSFKKTLQWNHIAAIRWRAKLRSTVYFIKYCQVDRYSHTTLLFALSVSRNSVSTFVGVWASVCLGARATSRRRHTPTEGVPCRHAIGGRLASDRRSAELPGVSDRSTTMGTVVRHGLNIHLYMSIFSQIWRRRAHIWTFCHIVYNLFVSYVFRHPQNW